MDKTSDLKKFCFSILMANYNNEIYIKEAIDSVLAQTYPYWELIIVDDNSKDNSIEKINIFLKKDNIRLIKCTENIGYGGTLKTAADDANFDIIGILDADDKLHEKALETMADAYLNNPDHGFIYSTMYDCDSNLENCVVNKMVGPTIPEKTNIFNIRVSHFKTFRRDLYKKTSGFDPNQKRAVDKDIIFKMEEVTKFKFIDTPLYYYRHHESGISQGKTEREAWIYHYIAKCKAYRRRLNKDIPNVSLQYLYFEYFKITFHKLNRKIKTLMRIFKASNQVKKLLNLSRFLTGKSRILNSIIEEIIKELN